MDLSKSLVKAFASVVNSDEDERPVSQTYGTITGRNLVMIDGSTMDTPCVTSVDMEIGDRVIVQIRNHQVVILGNITTPTDAAKGLVEDLTEDVVDLMDDQIVQVVTEYCLADENYIPAGKTFEDIRRSPWSEKLAVYRDTNLTDSSGEYILDYTEEELATLELGVDSEYHYSDGRYFYWRRTKIVHADGSITYTDPVFDASATTSKEAKIAANVADDAADAAQQIADQAKGIAEGTAKYFWHDSSGAHVSDTQNDVSTGNSQTISSNGTVIMRNGKLVTSWTGGDTSKAALNFYDCNSTDVTTYNENNKHTETVNGQSYDFYQPYTNQTLVASYNSKGMLLYANGHRMMSLTPSGLVFYSSDGTNKMAEYLANGINLYSYKEISGQGYNLLSLSIDGTNGVQIYDGLDTYGNPKVRARFGSTITLYGSSSVAELSGSRFTLSSSTTYGVYLYIEPGSIVMQDASDETSFLSTQSFSVYSGSLSFNTNNDERLYVAGNIHSNRSGEESQVLAQSGAGTIYLYSQASSSGNFGIYSITAGGTALGLIGVNQSRYVYYNAYHFVWNETYNNDQLEFFYDWGASGAAYPKFRPVTSDWVYLGSSQCRWAACYVVGGVFNGSDRKIKSVLDDFDWKVDDFIRGLRPVAYHRKHEDGTVGHRVHMGFIAQDVRDLSNELNLGDMSVYSADVVSKDADGNPIEGYYNGDEIDDEHLNWSLTYTEFIAPIVLELQRLMARVDELERRNA